MTVACEKTLAIPPSLESSEGIALSMRPCKPIIVLIIILLIGTTLLRLNQMQTFPKSF